MLCVHTVARCVFRSTSIQPFRSNVAASRLASSRRRMQASFPRTFSVSSSDEPITISSDRHNITIRQRDGSTITQRISPTPKASSEKLAVALASLLSAPDSDPSTHPTFGTLQWELDSLGDAIHRHIAVSSPDESESVVQLIMVESEKLNHHPHIARSDSEGSCMTITCTTHSPRGLSVRDTRLAMKIDEILAGFNVMVPARPGVSEDPENTKAKLATERGRMIGINRQAISEALESCACSTKSP